MHRHVYRAQVNPGAQGNLLSSLRDNAHQIETCCQKNDILTLSVYKWERDIFTYYECIEKDLSPEDLFGNLSAMLEKWPGQYDLRYWVPMMDIYHCCEPVHANFWKRARPIKRVYASINRLRPEMLSSYIFYHYQYQEEKPGDWAKYASIYLHENLLFFYREEPDEPVKPPYHGRLTTNNTPGHWQDLMSKHFLPWLDDPTIKEPWREIEQVYHLYIP
jgi:hypothetical protein